MGNYIPLVPTTNGSPFYSAHGIPLTPIFLHPSPTGSIPYLYPTVSPVRVVLSLFSLSFVHCIDLDLSICSSSISDQSIRCIDASISCLSINNQSSSTLSRSIFSSIISNDEDIASEIGLNFFLRIESEKSNRFSLTFEKIFVR